MRVSQDDIFKNGSSDTSEKIKLIDSNPLPFYVLQCKYAALNAVNLKNEVSNEYVYF